MIQGWYWGWLLKKRTVTQFVISEPKMGRSHERRIICMKHGDLSSWNMGFKWPKWQTCQGWIGGTPQPHQRNSGAHFGPDMNESSPKTSLVDMGSDLGERDYMVEGFWRVHAPDFIFWRIWRFESPFSWTHAKYRLYWSTPPYFGWLTPSFHAIRWPEMPAFSLCCWRRWSQVGPVSIPGLGMPIVIQP